MNASKTKLPSAPDWKDMTIDDLPNSDMRLVAEVLGIKTAIELMKNFEGTAIDVPRKGKVKLLEKYICANYDGTFTTAKKLSRLSGMSLRHTIRLIAQHKKNGTIKQ